MSDCIDLGPDDILREGDEQKLREPLCRWFPVYHERIGSKAACDEGWMFRRPRHTLIRDAAIELLRDALFFRDCLTDSEDALREAIGISVEELRCDP